MEIPVQIVPCDMCRIIAVPGAALRSPLDRRLNVFFPTDPQDSFIINSDAMLFIQFIPDPTIPHVGMGIMDTLDFLRNLFVVFLAKTGRIFQPSVIGTAGYVKVLAQSLHWIRLFFRQFFDRLVFIQMPSQRQRSFISNSLIFFSRSFSI